MDEQELILQSTQGNLDSFNRLVELYQVQVYNLALRMLGDAAAAEDVAQETFLSAFRSLKGFKAGNFRAWLMRIAANGCRDYLRSARVRRNVSLEAMDENPSTALQTDRESPEAYALRRELSELIQAGLTRLPGDQRLVLILVDIQGLSYEETAHAIGVPIGTVKSRLSRARLSLRDYLLTQRELLPGNLRLR